MEATPIQPKKNARKKVLTGAVLMLWKELLRDPKAFRILMACTLAMVTAGLEPAFLTLSTPEIQNQLRNPGSHAPLYIAMGFLLLAMLTLVAGTSGDLFGRKLILVGGLGLLTVANLWGALTLGTPQFIVTDIIGAITAAAVIPMCVSLVTLAFPSDRRPLAFAVLFGSSGVAIITGASIGGIFDALGIPNAAFIPVVIVGILAIRLVVRNVPESRAVKGFRRTNAVINLMMLVSIFVLIYLALAARSALIDWLPVLVACAIVLITGANVRWLRRRVSFFRDVETFTGRDTGFSMLAGVVLFMGEGTIFYQLTTFFQKVQGMGVVQAGISFAPFIIGMLVGSFLIPALAIRLGARRIIIVGMLLMSAGLFLFAFIQVDTAYGWLLAPMILAGIGFGIGNPARTQVVLSAPPVELTGSAAAVNTAVSQSGYGLGVVISSLLIASTANDLFMAPLAAAGIPETTLQKIEAALPGIFSQTASGDYPGLPQAILDMASASYSQAFTTAMGRTFLIMAVALVLVAALIYIGMHRRLRIQSGQLLKQNTMVDETPAGNDTPPL